MSSNPLRVIQKFSTRPSPGYNRRVERNGLSWRPKRPFFACPVFETCSRARWNRSGGKTAARCGCSFTPRPAPWGRMNPIAPWESSIFPERSILKSPSGERRLSIAGNTRLTTTAMAPPFSDSGRCTSICSSSGFPQNSSGTCSASSCPAIREWTARRGILSAFDRQRGPMAQALHRGGESVSLGAIISACSARPFLLTC